MANKIPITVTVNGTKRRAEVEPRLLLVHFLREDLGLTGTHVGCDTSNCSACAVIMDGRAVKSCAVLAVQADGRDIMTVEGLAKGDRLHPVQQALIDEQAVQCGYCFNGMIIQAADLLSKTSRPTEAQIRSAMNGHLCRCGSYPRVIRAIRRASHAMASTTEDGASMTLAQQTHVAEVER